MHARTPGTLNMEACKTASTSPDVVQTNERLANAVGKVT
jgi:hypothetical protein